MFFKNTYNELLKIAYKPRSYIGIGGITIIFSLILFALKLDGQFYISIITGQFEQSLSFEGNILNGNLIAFIILQMLIIHVPLLIAFVTGDMISGESAMGTIRLLATKPISRSNILLSKFLASCVYTLIVIICLIIMSLVLGKLLFGNGDLIVLKSEGLIVFQEQDIIWRFFYGFLIAFLSLVTVATLSLTLSCFSENSIGPIVSTMGIILLFTIIGTLEVPVFDNIKPFLFTTHMAAWRYFFDDPLSISQIIYSIAILVAHILFLLCVALYKFNKKDILS
ncbi:MAG: ABC transporter permease subunit [Bacteroidota bacterium]|nr:ABC transporter permease subunit [Bacteroidota bacterium]